MGRPSKYTEALADEICARLSAGEGLNAICQEDKYPDESTVRGWAMDDYNGFSTRYTRAREIQAHTLGEQIIAISNTPLVGSKTKTTDDGKVETTEGDMIEHRRLQIDARKWYLSKVLPKVYGEKIHQEHSGEIGIRSLAERMRKRAEK